MERKLLAIELTNIELTMLVSFLNATVVSEEDYCVSMINKYLTEVLNGNTKGGE